MTYVTVYFAVYYVLGLASQIQESVIHVPLPLASGLHYPCSSPFLLPRRQSWGQSWAQRVLDFGTALYGTGHSCCRTQTHMQQEDQFLFIHIYHFY